VIPLKNSAVHFPAAFFAAMLFASPTTWAQAHSDFLAPLIDQKMILLHIGSQEKVKAKKQDLQKLAGNCDIAVQLKTADWDQGKARLWFQNIGQAFATRLRPSANPSAPTCPFDHGHVALEISGFSRDESSDSVEAAVRQILLTPEEYIASGGVKFEPAASNDDEAVANCAPPTVPARILLTVEPQYSDQARKAKYNGTVQVGVIVGSDGRIHKAHITRSLGMGLDEKTLEILPLWRFQPATLNGKPVACAMGIEVSFTLF
jgi:TonB family protein